LTQSEDVSSRDDAPHLTRVVIQTNVEFPTLRLALQCDGPIVEGNGGINGAMMMVSEGVANGYPNVFVLKYGSASPHFGLSSLSIAVKRLLFRARGNHLTHHQNAALSGNPRTRSFIISECSISLFLYAG
jgi:hypothetical protein